MRRDFRRRFLTRPGTQTRTVALARKHGWTVTGHQMSFEFTRRSVTITVEFDQRGSVVAATRHGQGVNTTSLGRRNVNKADRVQDWLTG
jgi:hypothetical protein